jgi:hypothetical protein
MDSSSTGGPPKDEGGPSSSPKYDEDITVDVPVPGFTHAQKPSK